MSITPKENFLRAYRREKTEWVPLYSDMQVIVPNVVPDNKARAMIIEAQPLPESEWGGKDMFGIEWEYVPVAKGSMEKHGTALMDDVNDWKEKVTFPDVDSWPWEEVSARNRDFINRDKLVQVWMFSGMFERLISFMGFEDAAIALIDEEQQDAIHELFDAIADTYIDVLSHYKKYFGIDCVYFHDDWGSQKAPFFSLDVVMEMIVPHFKKVSDYCHANNIIFEMHSCGKNEKLAPAYIALGAQAWCGQSMNDKYALRETYGEDIIIGLQFPQGSKEEIKTAFDDFAAKAKDDFIKKPMYLQTIMWSPENIEYLRDLGREFMKNQ